MGIYNQVKASPLARISPASTVIGNVAASAMAAYGFSRWGLDYLGPQAAEAAEN